MALGGQAKNFLPGRPKPFPSQTMAKKSFVLRIDEPTYAALEKWAADEFRSVNGQLEWMIDRALKEASRSPKEQRPKPKPEENKTDV